MPGTISELEPGAPCRAHPSRRRRSACHGRGRQTAFDAYGVPMRAVTVHAMSDGHSEAFELGVHWRTHEPVAPSAGTAAQNVSA